MAAYEAAIFFVYTFIYSIMGFARKVEIGT
jgi:hypothetical protein